MSKKTLKGEIVVEVLKQYPNTPSLTLSRKIYDENPEVFSSVEDVRSAVRYYRGARGTKGRISLSDKSIALEWNKYKLPESEAEDYEPFYIDIVGTTLICSDIHIPYHSVEAITAMFEYCKDKVDAILINGDFWDFHQLSYFLKDPRKRGVKYELDAGKAFFHTLRQVFPTQKIYFKLGNHDERWEKYLMQKAPELYDTSLFHLEDLFNFADFGIETITDKRTIYLGGLRVLHGHELGIKDVNVSPARTVFLKTFESTLIGHVHRTSEHTEKNLSGETVSCYSIGCLSELNPMYAPINKYNHGFALVETDQDGNFRVENKRIDNGFVL